MDDFIVQLNCWSRYIIINTMEAEQNDWHFQKVFYRHWYKNLNQKKYLHFGTLANVFIFVYNVLVEM